MFLLRLVWAVVRALFVRRADLVAENLARQQIIVFHRKAETSTRGALAFSASTTVVLSLRLSSSSIALRNASRARSWGRRGTRPASPHRST